MIGVLSVMIIPKIVATLKVCKKKKIITKQVIIAIMMDRCS